MKLKYLLFSAAVLILMVLYYQNSKQNISGMEEEAPAGAAAMAYEKKDTVEYIQIKDGTSYSQLMKQASTSYETAMEIYEAAAGLYDLAKIRAERIIELVFDKDSGELKKLLYKIDSEDELTVSKICPEIKDTGQLTASGSREMPEKEDCRWQADISAIPYEIKTKISEGRITSSMYQAALDNDIDIRAIIELANAFQWTIDFAMDPRVDDSFKFAYEERWLDGQYIMPGKIAAAYYVNDGKKYEVYYFEESAENKGFFDQDGNSVQKMFLKAPVAFKYISSGFTTGLRYIKAFNVSTGHRAIDYAAPAGTPIRTVGDGTVVFAGWSSQGYGYLTSIRHNSTYTTNYAHQSKIAVKYGQKVKQGDIIGYVGSTGFSTGPHLHYEMVKHGEKINPLHEALPPGEPIKEENRERFFSEIKKWQDMLNG